MGYTIADRPCSPKRPNPLHLGFLGGIEGAGAGVEPVCVSVVAQNFSKQKNSYFWRIDYEETF